MHIVEKIMKSVVRVEATLKSGVKATGSGFAYRLAVRDDGSHVPAIITNKHVIEDAVSVSLPISTADMKGNPTGNYEVITYAINTSNIIMHPDLEIDLCAILSAPIYNHLEGKSQVPILAALEKSIAATDQYIANLLPLEEVTMVGYPNGLWDSHNNDAIARRGVIATTPGNDYLGKKQFVVDMACFPGSSGSPVFLMNAGSFTERNGNTTIGTRFKLLGVLYAGPRYNAEGKIIVVPVPTTNIPIASTSIPNNLGYVIKASQIDAFECIAEKFLND